MKLVIKCFGGFAVPRYDGLPGKVFCKSQKACELFAFLLSHHPSKVPDDSLFENFWPGMIYSKARQNLNSTVYLLRKSLSEWLGDAYERNMINDNRSMLWLELPQSVTADFILYEANLCRAERDFDTEDKINALEEAVEMYAGDFMIDFCDSRWVRKFQEQYREIQIEALNELSELLYLKHKNTGSLKYVSKALLMNPQNQNARRLKNVLLDIHQADSTVTRPSAPEALATVAFSRALPNIDTDFLGASVVDPVRFFKRVQEWLIGEEQRITILSVKVSCNESTKQKHISEYITTLASLLRRSDLMTAVRDVTLVAFRELSENATRRTVKRVLSDEKITHLTSLHSIQVSYTVSAITTLHNLAELRARHIQEAS